MKESITYKNLRWRPRNNYPKKVIIHESGGIVGDPLADTSHHTVPIIEAGHLKRGWDGFAYHYGLPKHGEAWKGRPESYNGAHAGKEHNYDSIGILVIGNFSVTLPSKNQENLLKSILKDIRGRYPNIPIEPHRKYAKRVCYGKLLKDDWARNLVKPDDSKNVILSIIDAIVKMMEYLKKAIMKL